MVRAVSDRGGERDAFFALVTLVPAVCALALLPLFGHLDLSRCLLYVTPLLILTVAGGLSVWRIPRVGVVCLILTGAAMPWSSLQAYYDAPVKDYDAGPIVTYLTQSARHAGSQDTILVAPGYVTDTLRYLSRGTLAYQRMDADADLERAVAAAAQERRIIWLVVDYRWPQFEQIARDTRFEPQSVPMGMPSMIRLFRSRAK